MKLNSQEINQIDTSKLSIFKPNLELAFYLAKKDKIDFVYNTSALEGNAMTYPEVQTLLEGVTVGGHKLSDQQQILNQNKSVDYLFKLIETKTFKLPRSHPSSVGMYTRVTITKQTINPKKAIILNGKK